ncbi:ATP cone domain-containing protein [Eubacterium ramulus]|uniref:ATP cone domain-containing protein n=1 Tax=Eubacterium ramulus TaxID=39490 RepID=UPI00399C143F
MYKILKKDGTLEDYNEQKIIDACNKASKRAMYELSNDNYKTILDDVFQKLKNYTMKIRILKFMICIISWNLC